MKTDTYDFLVIGSGLAGLTFALHAAQFGRVAVVTKAALTDTNTSWAQGGIAAAIGDADSIDLHEQDTLIAGAGLCDPEAVRFLVTEAPGAIEWLRSLGTQFDPELGREGGHSRNRIVHHADKTGWEIERSVSQTVRDNPRIDVFEQTFVTRLLTHNQHCVGATVRIGDAEPRAFLARATLLATGGAGKIYAQTTNPSVATADGIALAAAIGADIEDMEFMQFHPTVLYHNQLKGFLITEAMRGAGATLRTHLGDRFMYDYDERLELAPRDIVARAIEAQMKRLDTWCVYLDATHLTPAALQHEFPTIWQRLRSIGLNIERNWIPVTPAQHYSCGGVKTNLSGETSIPGLYAAGEVARTGVHGANRLASNSLLEALVFARAAAQNAENAPALPVEIALDTAQPHCIPEPDAIRIRHGLQALMSKNAGVFRTTAGLLEAEKRIAAWRSEYQALPSAPFSPYARECENLLIAAEHVIAGALRRTQNVGLHYNADLIPASK